MSAELGLDLEDFAKVKAAVKEYGAGAEKAIADILHDSGESIYREINPLIHPSGRKFKGHGSSAAASAWPRYDTNDPLSVTVATRSKFHYLYFPDDGSNTDHHQGMQQFFKRGGEAAAPRIVDRCLDALVSEWKER